jgi:2,3-bisphosphoglycerate-independent phosphoglycerate mutase
VKDKVNNEIIDEKVVKVIKDSLDEMGVNYKILILPDHPSVSKMTHTSEPVTFLTTKAQTK